MQDSKYAIYNNSKVLITGGVGFIGSNLARRLVKLGAEVTLIDSLIPEYGGNLQNIKDIESQVRVNISDVRDEFSIGYLVQGKDYLFNLAGQTSHLGSMTDPFTDLEINVRAQLYILEACRKQNPKIRIVFTSTRQIYGAPEYLPVDEKHPLSPVDINGINKMCGDWYHILYNNVYGIKSSGLRLTNTYGPGMRIKDARQTFLGIWLRLILEGKPFEVWGGKQIRDFNYVDDVVDALLMTAIQPDISGKIFNIGGHELVSLQELADMLIEVHGGGNYVVKQFPTDRAKIDIGDYYTDWNAIKAQVGWEPRVDLRTGLKTALDYYQANLQYYV